MVKMRSLQGSAIEVIPTSDEIGSRTVDISSWKASSVPS